MILKIREKRKFSEKFVTLWVTLINYWFRGSDVFFCPNWMELQMRFFQKHKKYFYFVMKKQISESKNKENLELPDVE